MSLLVRSTPGRQNNLNVRRLIVLCKVALSLRCVDVLVPTRVAQK